LRRRARRGPVRGRQAPTGAGMNGSTRALSIAVLALAGCGGGSETGSAPATAATPAAAPAPAATEAEQTALDQLPTTDQLEQQLDQTVTEQNADTEFEKLQQEIDKDAEAGG